ncbi:MAG TPA: hypothetical protein VKO45_09070 [Methanomicrobiales archaeon]|nr:hypothetical protein [Methanomicrobiales archaeon]
MAIIQSGNDPDCKHEKTTPEERSLLGCVPVYVSNCLACGEYLMRFPTEDEVPKATMEKAFDATQQALRVLSQDPKAN